MLRKVLTLGSDREFTVRLVTGDHTRNYSMRVARIELASTAWKAVILPLNHTRERARRA